MRILQRQRTVPQIGAASGSDRCAAELETPATEGDGRWRPSAAALADVLGCTCEDLFSESQRTLALRDNHGECYVTEAELLKLFSRVERPLLENPAEQLMEDADEEAKSAVIRRALDGLDSHRTGSENRSKAISASVASARTLTDLAGAQEVVYQFVQGRSSTTLHRLRGGYSAAHRSLLQAYRPADAMGRADRRACGWRGGAPLRFAAGRRRGSTPEAAHASAAVLAVR